MYWALTNFYVFLWGSSTLWNLPIFDSEICLKFLKQELEKFSDSFWLCMATFISCSVSVIFHFRVWFSLTFLLKNSKTPDVCVYTTHYIHSLVIFSLFYLRVNINNTQSHSWISHKHEKLTTLNGSTSTHRTFDSH